MRDKNIDATLQAFRVDKPDPSESKTELAEMIASMDQSNGKN